MAAAMLWHQQFHGIGDFTRMKRELYAGGQSLKPSIRPSYERTTAEDWPPTAKQPPPFLGSIAEVCRRVRAWGEGTADSMRIH